MLSDDGMLSDSVVVCVWVCWSIPEVDGRVPDGLGVAPVGEAAVGPVTALLLPMWKQPSAPRGWFPGLAS